MALSVTINKQVAGPGEMVVSFRAGDVLVAHGLGSCLGVAVHDPRAGVAGLLHVMLPESRTNPGRANTNPLMFVDTGVMVFLNKLRSLGVDFKHCRTVIVGGASINSKGKDYFEIGRRNYVALRKTFWRQSLLIKAEHVGGTDARTFYMDVETGRTWLTIKGQRVEL